VEFYDQGTGVPPEAIDKVLNPFFSTKSGGTGTGLGLSTSRNILMQHNGTISVESAYGDYTRVTVEVPALEGNNDERAGD
jgi:signal transduction histidine kinase